MQNQKAKHQKLVTLLLGWFKHNARDLPWRRTRDPYAIWVSEIMLQQTQVKTVMPFWERWLRELPTIESVAKASSEKIHKLWEGLGYYSRARNLQKAAQIILGKHAGKFPQKFDDILALPGIGRYTAGAICSIAFNQPKPILDGNVIRVLTRIFGIKKNPREKETNKLLWQIAEELVLNSKLKTQNLKFPCSHLNQSLMELGALICTPRNPKCLICPARKLCIAFKENRVEEFPNLGRREKTTARRFVAFVIERDGKFLVQQRPEKVVNAHLWEFPNFESKGDDLSAEEIFKSHFGFTPKFQPLCAFKHSITRYRITVEAFCVSIKPRTKNISGNENWFSLKELDSLAFTSAHRKILKQLESQDLISLAGSWIEDKKFNGAIAAQQKIDWSKWK